MTRIKPLKVVPLTLRFGVAAGALIGSAALAQPPAQTPEPEPVEQSAEPSPSGAEEVAGSSEEIVVTGTSIRGVAPVGAPVLGVSQDQILQQPATTTTDLLRQIPAVSNLGASDQFFGAANNSNANITGGNGINLRGLGTEATLTLLNGRRLPPAGTQGQFFDPSIIPTSAIGRLEVMADGGSAIDGSDAVGGVVNILLRRRFTGVEAYTKRGFNDDVQSFIVGGVLGHSWGSGSIMIAAEHNDRTPLRASARRLYTDDLRAFGGSDQRLFTANPGNIQIGSTRYPIPAGQTGIGLTPGLLRPESATNPANRESTYLGADAIPGQNRDSIIGNIRQEVTSGVELWVEGYYADRRLDRTVNPLTANLTVPATNPFFVVPAGATAPLCPGSAGVPAGTRCVTVNYSFSGDYGPRVQDAFQKAWQAAAGFDAELGSNWNLTGYGSYGRNIEERSQGAINNVQLLAALRDPSAATALNPFGDGSNTSRATLDRILGFSAIGARYYLWDFGAKLDGALFTLPGGEVKLAVGAEYQDHKLTSYFRDNTSTANTRRDQLSSVADQA